MEDVVNSAKQLFKEKGLFFPRVYSSIGKPLMQITPTLYSSRVAINNPLDIEAVIDEVLSRDVEDYLLMGFDKDMLYYYFVYGQLAIFIQRMVDTKEETLKGIQASIMGSEVLLQTMKEAEKEGLLEDLDKRLIVIESKDLDTGWTWVEGHPRYIDIDKWNSDEPIYLNATLSIPNI